MKYKYYFGPSGSGKSTRVMDDLIGLSRQNPSKTFYLIVPDQYTMQAQKDMVLRSPEKGIMNIDVLSFGRLSHTVFDETGKSECTVLDDTGKNLLLRRVALDIAGDLKIIGSSINGQGIIHEIKSVISEFMQYGYSPEDIEKLIECADSNNMKSLKYKLQDLQKLYKAFQEYKKEKYVTTEETLGILADMIPKAECLKNSIIAFDGFTGFTPVQKRVLSALLRTADEVWFSICLDERAYHGDKQSSKLFDLSLRTLNGIDILCREEGALHLEDVFLFNMEAAHRDKVSKELCYLEKNIFRESDKPFDEECQNISISYLANPRSELEYVCRNIKRLVRQEKYEYRDIAILTGDLETYSQYADEMFELYDLPGFVDSSRKLVFNPFTDHIKSCLNVIYQNYSYQAVMHFLRSGISVFTDEEIDDFDNYILALKIKGKNKYSKPFDKYPKYMKTIDPDTGRQKVREDCVPLLEQINQTREKLYEMFSLFAGLEKGNHKAKTYISSLYDFLLSENIAEKISEYADFFEKKEDFAKKKEYDQIYRSVMVLLEQLYMLLSDDELELKEFMDILDAGISEIRIGVLPAQVDSLVMGDIERTRLSSVKVMFFLGVNDNNIPKNNSNGGMISDLDREFFSINGIELSPSPRQKMFDQRLYLYMNMTKPSEKLFISYSGTGSDGKAMRPSYLIDTVLGMFPGMNVITQKSGSEECLAEQIEGKKSGSILFANLMREYAKGSISKSQDDFFKTLFDMESQYEEEKTRALCDAAFFKYHQNNLAKSIVHSLYGNELVNSISRLEAFAACAYSHYLSYGLNLKEREQFDITALDTGNILHAVLWSVSEKLKTDGIKWSELTPDIVEGLVENTLKQVVPDYGEDIFGQDKRSEYQVEKMKKALIKSVLNISMQVKESSFIPKDFEYKFKSAVNPGQFTVGLSEDEIAYIKGKIDRIDTYENNNKIYVKVVDYKSSDHKLNLVQLYNGLSLQLVIYLDQAVKKYRDKNPDKTVKPAGMYYYHVFDPVVYDDKSDIKKSDEQINKWIENMMRQTGLGNTEDDLVNAIAGDFSDKSRVVNATMTSKGDISSESEFVSSDDMDTILEFAEFKMQELIGRIASGEIGISPCGKDACSYCNFKGVCGYDERIKGYPKDSYIGIPGKGRKVKLDAIKEKLSIVKADNAKSDRDNLSSSKGDQ